MRERCRASAHAPTRGHPLRRVRGAVALVERPGIEPNRHAARTAVVTLGPRGHDVDTLVYGDTALESFLFVVDVAHPLTAPTSNARVLGHKDILVAQVHARVARPLVDSVPPSRVLGHDGRDDGPGHRSHGAHDRPGPLAHYAA